MKKTDMRREVARNLYISGCPIDEIAARVGKCRATIFRWKNLDQKRGIDWDRLKLERHLGEQEFKSKHQVFLFALFSAFEKDLTRLNEIEDPEKRLDLLERYSNSYYKLMNAAKREAPEIAIAEVAGKTLEKVAKLAAEEGKRDILEWLLSNIEPIKGEIIKEFQRG